MQWFDAALVVGLLGLTAVTLLVGQPLHVTALSALQVAPLAWRRSRPATTFALVWLFSGVQALVYDYPAIGQLAYPVALYSLARFGRSRDALVGLVLSLVATGVAAWVWVMAGRYDDPPPGVVQPDLSLTTFLPYTLTVGGITGMIVQADGARYAAEHDPDVAVRTLETVASTGREALTEMRRLLGLLRGTSDPELVPQPGLADLPRLLAADVEAGRVRATLPDPAPAMPDGVALTVFRVVQESLTNVRKHAGAGATAAVDVTVDGPDVLVEVVDDGHGAAHTSTSGGLGLVGMRERVAVHGGTLDVGPAPGGGWRVRARIPR